MSPPDFVGGYNKAFRERQHPSALDQWTNSPFMGQQVGNYKSFPLCIHHHIQLISLSFQVSQPSRSWYSNFNILPWKPKVKVIGEVKVESHKVGVTSLSFPCQSAVPFLRYDFFKIWPWKSKVKVVIEVKVECHKVDLTSLSFHVNRPFHSWDTKFSKFDLKNSRWKWNDNDVAQLQV